MWLSKTKYGENIKLCYKATDRFIVHAKTDDIYKDIAVDIERRFDTSNFDIDRPLPKGKNKKVIGLMNNELGGQIMKKFVGSRAQTYSYLINDSSENKKAKCPEKCVIKKQLKYQDHKNCLPAKIDRKLKYLEKKLIKVNLKKLWKTQKHNIKNTTKI